MLAMYCYPPTAGYRCVRHISDAVELANSEQHIFRSTDQWISSISRAVRAQLQFHDVRTITFRRRDRDGCIEICCEIRSNLRVVVFSASNQCVRSTLHTDKLGLQSSRHGYKSDEPAGCGSHQSLGPDAKPNESMVGFEQWNWTIDAL